MLDLIRRKAQSRLIQAIIIIIILVFIFWGVGTNQGSGTNAVALVNGESIIFADYQKEYDRMVTQLRDKFGGTIPKGLLEATNFKQQVIDQLIQTALMKQGAENIGLYVSDNELRQTIESMDAFQNNGAFDVKWYEEILTGSRLSVTNFEEGLRYDLLSAKIVDHLQRFGQVSENEITGLYKYNNDQIDLQYAKFAAADFKEKVTVNEDDLKTFFAENKESYNSLPQVKIKYIHLPLAGENLSASFSDDELLTKYQDNIVKYTNPERRHARHILIRSSESDPAEQISAKRDSLNDILNKARSGEDFSALAKQFSEDGSASRGGDLGFFAKGQMVKPFEDAVFALNEGEISDIIQTQFGFHLIKLEAIKESGITPFEEVKAEISASLQAEMGQTLAFQKANETYEQIILSGSIDKYAASKKTEANSSIGAITETNFFDQQDPPKELRTLPTLVNTAFTLKNGELSSIIDTGQGYAIVYVQDRKEPAPQDLSPVREQVVNDFVQKEARQLAKDSAEHFLAKLKEGADFTKEAADLQISIETTGFVSRTEYSASQLPAQILQQNFNLSKNNPYATEVADAGDIFFVIGYKDSQDSNQEQLNEEKDALIKQLTGEKANSLITAWVSYLREEADIKVYENML